MIGFPTPADPTPSAAHYPVMLDLRGRLAVVIGGGAIAEGKLRELRESGARVRVVSPEVSAGIAVLARAGEVEHVRRAYEPGDLRGARLAIAATDDRAVNRAVWEEAESLGVLLNAVDDVEHCHFAVPSIVRRGELLLAISTGGRAPALAKRLRRRLSDELGWEWEALVDVLGEVRAATLPHRPADFAIWAARWRAVLDREEELLDLLAEGRIDEVKARVYAALKPATTSAHCSGSVR
jgi:siroheme synthase-like protein